MMKLHFAMMKMQLAMIKLYFAMMKLYFVMMKPHLAMMKLSSGYDSVLLVKFDYFSLYRSDPAPSALEYLLASIKRKSYIFWIFRRIYMIFLEKKPLFQAADHI